MREGVAASACTRRAEEARGSQPLRGTRAARAAPTCRALGRRRERREGKGDRARGLGVSGCRGEGISNFAVRFELLGVVDEARERIRGCGKWVGFLEARRKCGYREWGTEIRLRSESGAAGV